MPADERERLRKDLSADSARLTVVTAVSLTSGEQEQWTDRLCASLSQKDKTDFATDPGILGGAEIRFPHAVLKFTWADQLRKAQELLRKDDTAS
jgi:F-type H+-transporting ATPase subunit b